MSKRLLFLNYLNLQNAKPKKKRWLEKWINIAKIIPETRRNTTHADSSQKLHKKKETVAFGNDVYLRIRRWNEDKKRHKIVADADYLCPVHETSAKITLNQQKDKIVKHVRRGSWKA